MEADQNHIPATEAAARLCERSRLILLPTAVFVETLNGLGKRSGHETALETARDFIVQDHLTLLVNSKALGKSGLKTTVKARKNLAHAVNEIRS